MVERNPPSHPLRCSRNAPKVPVDGPLHRTHLSRLRFTVLVPVEPRGARGRVQAALSCDAFQPPG